MAVVSDANGSRYAFNLTDGTTVSGIEWFDSLTTGSGDDRVTFANTTVVGTQTGMPAKATTRRWWTSRCSAPAFRGLTPELAVR